MKRKKKKKKKGIRSWYIWLHLFSHLLYKRTVNVSSVIPVMNWAASQRGPHASCSSVTLLPASCLLLHLFLLLLLPLLLSLAVVVSWNWLQMQLCNTIRFCPLLLALLDFTDAELRKSNEFNIIRNFRLLHTRCLEEREKHQKLYYFYSYDKNNRCYENLLTFIYILYTSWRNPFCVLTNLNVTFLLLWGSSTIFCKLAATKQKTKGSERTKSDDQLIWEQMTRLFQHDQWRNRK